MKKTTLSLILACGLGFFAATLALLLLFSEGNTSNAQTLPFLQQRQRAGAPADPTRVAANPPQGRPDSAIPEASSSLPRPMESPLYVERYAELTPEERISVEVYENCNRSVVNIDTRTTYNVIFLGSVDEPGAGSGIILDREGHVLTNSHVVSQVDSVAVTLFNGESYPATVVGEDPITDLAVLKIQAPSQDLFPVTLGDSSKLLVGQKVFAIGNPFGLERTLTSGLISSLNRSIPGRSEARPIKGTIQIDAAINPGNSGGALLDTKGRMIGINTAIASKSGGSHGVGFAIPSNTVARIVPQLIKNGKVIRGDSGIAVVREVERQNVRGLLVYALVPKGAAQRAGLREPRVVKERALLRGTIPFERSKIDLNAADVIVSVNGKPTKRADEFTAVIDEHKPGDRIELDVIREGRSVKVPLVLE